MRKELNRVTRADVAREADVSETIVSYVINGNRYVDDAKRRRVEAAVKKLHYSPNAMARALKGKKTNHILFIADDIMSGHFGKIISEMDAYAYDKGYFISLCSDRNDDLFVRRIYERFFDGIVIASFSFSERNIQRLIQTNIPVVLFAIRKYKKFEGTYGQINTGLYDGARLCVKALHERGRRKLLFIDRLNEGKKLKTDDDERYRGFAAQCKAYGLDFHPGCIISGCKSEAELTEQVRAYFNKGGASLPADGVFGITDSVACAAMEGIKQAGFSVPGTVSVVGFNNSRMCEYTSPRLSSVRIDRKQAGRCAAEMLEKLGAGTQKAPLQEELKITLSTKLVLRESI